MVLDLRKFYTATNPSTILTGEDEEERRLYSIDFSSVRGGPMIAEICDRIIRSPDEPTYQLFTGHIGCGISTELRRLKTRLEQHDFHVVYFESSEDLEMADVEVADILLAIAHHVSESLDSLQISLENPQALKKILQEAAQFVEIERPDEIFPNFGKITAKAKNSPELRSKLREYLKPHTASLLNAIDRELLEPAKMQLKELGKAGLVVLVDGLNRVENRPTTRGRPQHEHLFIDCGGQLNQLNCHVIYTMPLALMFSNDCARLTRHFSAKPHVLPMIPVRDRDGREHAEGMAVLRQVVLIRAFPKDSPEERLQHIPEIFDTPETLDRLCQVSGGHVRGLLRILNNYIKTQRQLPLTRDILEEVIQKQCDRMSKAIDNDEWELLRQVREKKRASGDANYDVLVRSMFVYEYRDDTESWFDINPLLAESKYFAGEKQPS
ncbi:MAG: ATP-binding protein [Cyanobacteria bacterium P01_E01_bin.42]